MPMPKWILFVIFLVVSALVCPGCGKPHSSLEGIVLNKSHEPIPGAVVIADQVQPVTGYWEFETITDKSGAFRLDRLYPDSDYKITIQVEDFQATDPITIHTLANKETFKMEKPIILGFLLRNDGAILDIATGLVWAPNPGIMLNWFQAKEYSSEENLLGESGWRLPTKVEVSDLFDKVLIGNRKHDGLMTHVNPIFGISYRYIWTSLQKGNQQDPSASAWLWDFSQEELEGKWASPNNEVAQVLSVKSIR